MLEAKIEDQYINNGSRRHLLDYVAVAAAAFAALAAAATVALVAWQAEIQSDGGFVPISELPQEMLRTLETETSNCLQFYERTMASRQPTTC